MQPDVLGPDTLDLVHKTRSLFEHLLSQATGQTATRGSCLYAAVLLQETLQKFSEFDAFVRGGGPGEREGCGYHDGTCWQGHYWVELQKDGAAVAVVDITADQFGGPKVQVMPWEFAVYRYCAGAQVHVDEAAAEVLSPD